MKCCVLSCLSYSDGRSDAMNGITFHSFPADNILREEWITIINRPNWTPKKHTRICSCHFNDGDFVVTKKGRKKLKKGTVPSLKLDLSLKRKLPEPMPSTSSDNNLNEFPIVHEVPKKRLKQEIEHLQYKEKKNILKIRSLQMKVNRLKKKVNNLTAIIGELKRNEEDSET